MTKDELLATMIEGDEVTLSNEQAALAFWRLVREAQEGRQELADAVARAGAWASEIVR